MNKIVIIEDDQDIRELVLYTLEMNGLEGLAFASFKEFLAQDIKEVDLFLLDIMLPDEDGLKILEKLRSNAKYSNLPIIMLTAKGSEMDKVKALNLGADDYIVKPFGVLELVARINARLRRQSKANIKSFKDIILNMDLYELRVNNKIVNLTNKELELLKYFLDSPNIVISRESLLEKIWGYDFEGESRTLDIHISNLRKNLGTSSKYLQTIRGIGYKLGEIND